MAERPAPLPRRSVALGELPGPGLRPWSRGSRENPGGRLAPWLPAGDREPRLATRALAAIGPGFPLPHGYVPCTAARKWTIVRIDRGHARRDATARGNVRRRYPSQPSCRRAATTPAHKT